MNNPFGGGLQVASGDAGLSFAAHVRNRRLEECRRALCQMHSVPVSEIAANWGFDDVSREKLSMGLESTAGNPPDVHIVVRVPGKEIVVSKELAHNGHKKADNDAYAVLDEAFATAQQQLKDWRRVSHGNVKYKSGEPRGAAGESGLETKAEP